MAEVGSWSVPKSGSLMTGQQDVIGNYPILAALVVCIVYAFGNVSAATSGAFAGIRHSAADGTFVIEFHCYGSLMGRP